MKAINVKILNKDQEKICATPEQAISFLEKHITVNEHSVNHIKTIFGNIYNGILNEYGGYDASFSAGNNSKNPTISFKEVTGATSVAELSPYWIKTICDRITKDFKKIEKDFKINSSQHSVSGGFNWYWSQFQQAHFAIYEFHFIPQNYNSLNELETAIRKTAQELINKYSKK